ncbi:podocalyxin-like protein 2 isoform X3 [Salvelinus alpinus]|uniref:podocalyxin-like protein 2 isoform X3 n=1 Tax=Salvelinus alpinus TaxID=8036 RepID=UPI0039FD4A28
MAGLHRTFIFGSTLLFLLSCDALLSDGPPTLLSTSQPSPLSLIDLDLDVEEQPEMMTVPGSPTTVPGLTSQGRETSQQDTSQEASGFFSEDGEDNKPLQSSVNLWDDVRDQVNITDLDRNSLRGYSQTLSQSSTSPMEEPRQGNHTSPFMTAMENLERELWEMERESSGLPVEPGYAQNQGLSTTTIPAADPVVPVDFTTLDPQYVPVHGGQESPPGDTVEVEVAEEEEETDGEMKRESTTTEPDVSIASSRPTLPEVGVFPSFGPLQPDNIHTEDREEVVEEGEEEDEEEEETVVLGGPGSDRGRGGAISPLTTVPSASLAPTVDFTEDSWDRLEDGREGREEEERRQEEQEVKNGGTELLTETDILHGAHFSQEIQQVICVDWSDLAGKGYIILNMSDSVDCDEFRVESGDRLLELLETAFSRKMDSPQGSWLISLSKPTMQDHQLLITLASEHGVIATKDVLSMLGEIRKGLHETRGEELHFVENGCHDNPTLDVTSDGGQPEMQEKKHHPYHHANGLTAGTGSGGMAGGEGGSSGWQVLVNKPGRKEEDNMEEDTHL